MKELKQLGRITGIPQNTEHDDTDPAILNICQAIVVDPPVQPSDITVSHRPGKPYGTAEWLNSESYCQVCHQKRTAKCLLGENEHQNSNKH